MPSRAREIHQAHCAFKADLSDATYEHYVVASQALIIVSPRMRIGRRLCPASVLSRKWQVCLEQHVCAQRIFVCLALQAGF